MTPALKELTQLHHDIFWTEKGHFAMAGFWRGVHTTLGLIATIASGLAAAALIRESSTDVALLLAAIGSVTAALLTFLKPQDISRSYLEAGRVLGEVRVKVRQARDLDASTDHPSTELRATIGKLAEDKANAERDTPHIPNAAMWYVDRRMRSGHYAGSDSDS